MNSAQFGCGTEAPPWCNTDTGSDAGRKLFIFLFFFKECIIPPLLLCLTFFDLAHFFLRQIFRGENCLFQCESMKICVVPLCSPTALYFLHLSFSLRKKVLFFVHSSNFRSYHWIYIEIKKKKKWHFNGVLSEPLQFSMLSYSNSHHLLWANNSISNLLTYLEGIRCDIWIFRPFYKLCYRRNIQ